MSEIAAGVPPFVTIQFESLNGPLRPAPVVRHWYFVPRIGGHVSLNEGAAAELDNGPYGFIAGYVEQIRWRDGGLVIVGLR